MADYTLSKGSHTTANEGRCAMEFVAYLANEPHSDTPVCVSPVLRRFCIAFNDSLDDVNRQRLRPYLARTIGTSGDGLDEERSWLAMDWLIRTYTPTWLALAGIDDVAERLRSLPPVLAVEILNRAIPDLREGRRKAAVARDAAGAAAGDAARAAAGAVAGAGAAAGDAAGDAAWAAAGDAAWDAARAAAGAVAGAGAAAGAAAGDAAGAGAAAGDAAKDALAPTISELHESAFVLLDRMLPTVPLVVPAAADADLICAL
jgi:hypothetical protein